MLGVPQDGDTTISVAVVSGQGVPMMTHFPGEVGHKATFPPCFSNANDRVLLAFEKIEQNVSLGKISKTADVLRPVVRHLRSLGLRVILYVDDFVLLIHKTEDPELIKKKFIQ